MHLQRDIDPYNAFIEDTCSADHFNQRVLYMFTDVGLIQKLIWEISTILFKLHALALSTLQRGDQLECKPAHVL